MATLQLVNAFDGSLTSSCSGFGPTRLSGPAGCTRIPTCRMRFWCSGGGGPPSGEVLLEEAIFKSHSEPPPLEWLSSELLDIPIRVVAAGCRMRKRSDEGRRAGLSKSRQLGWAWHHCADSQAVWKQTCRTDSVTAACSAEKGAAGMLAVSGCASEWRRERAFDAFPWNSAGSMTPSLTVGNLAITGKVGQLMWNTQENGHDIFG